MNNMTTIKKN